MSLFSNCRICKGQYHHCFSCGLTDSEEAPYDHGVCDKCFETSGARAIWDKWYEAKNSLDEEVSRCLEAFARNPFDPSHQPKE